MSRRLLAVAFLTPALCGAQQFGTKRDVMAAAGGSGSSMMPLFQMLVALGIVFALLKFGLPKLASKLNKKLVTGTNSSIQIEESANFAGGSLYIVTARGKTLLLSVGTNGVSNVADLTPTEKPVEQPLFNEILDQSVSVAPIRTVGFQPTVPVVESWDSHVEANLGGASQGQDGFDTHGLQAQSTPSEREVRRALDRLARLKA